jgi:hypothetical protein
MMPPLGEVQVKEGAAMITPLWKFNIALLWSVLGLPLGCVCILRACGWLARASSEPNVGMDYTPFVVLGGWAVVLFGLAAVARPGRGGVSLPREP